MELEVRNVGDAPTTISSVVLMAYRRTWFGLRGEEWNATIIHEPPQYTLSLKRPHRPIELEPQNLPYTLPGGGRFLSQVPQPPHERSSRKYYLYMGVQHSMASKPFLVRVPPIACRPVRGD
jgi:hypothetical protein